MSCSRPREGLGKVREGGRSLVLPQIPRRRAVLAEDSSESACLHQGVLLTSGCSLALPRL